MKILQSFSHLIFPYICVVCEQELNSHEQQICGICEGNIQLSNYQNYDTINPVEQLFEGRSTINFAYSHFNFKKGESTQKILFAFKYNSKAQLGVYFGKQIGKTIEEKLHQTGVDLILPIPLHPKKAFLRGYNQSEKLAEGISNSTKIKTSSKIARRIRYTEAQAKKNRFDRWSNLNNAFHVSPSIKKYSHVTIIDDVITTGSTIEQLILKIREIKSDMVISIVTLATA